MITPIRGRKRSPNLPGGSYTYLMFTDDNPDKGTETLPCHPLSSHRLVFTDDNPDKGTETFI